MVTQDVWQLGTLPEGAPSAVAVLATVGVRSQTATFVKSDVMAELSQLSVCGQALQPFCVLLSEQPVRLSSPPSSHKRPHAAQTVSWSIWKVRLSVFMSL